jgi:hypothetical protein
LVEICRFRVPPQLGAAPGPAACRMGERLVTAHLEAAGGRAEAPVRLLRVGVPPTPLMPSVEGPNRLA